MGKHLVEREPTITARVERKRAEAVVDVKEPERFLAPLAEVDRFPGGVVGRFRHNMRIEVGGCDQHLSYDGEALNIIALEEGGGGEAFVRKTDLPAKIELRSGLIDRKQFIR